MHDLPLITTITMAFTSAWVLGVLTQRLGMSPIVGYLLAGVLIGPHTPGFVGDVSLAQQLAEVGVILLMFGVGLHFHLRDLLAVKTLAIPGAIGQTAVTTVLGIFVFGAFGFSVHSSAVIGMALAVASTVVLMRVLLDAEVLDSPQGHVAVGWLLVEDVITVVILVLIPALAAQAGSDVLATTTEASSTWTFLGVALMKLTALVALVLLAGSRIVPGLLVQVARLRSRELFTLTILVLAIAIAAGSYVFFGASMALGAFLAGMVVGQSPVSQQAAADALPMRDAFAVLFFVSVGMLFDPAFVVQEPGIVVAALAIVLLVKPIAALVIVTLFGHSLRVGLTVALGLAQVGEFSFILSELARKHDLMPDAGHNTLVAAAIISITLNPLLFRWIEPIEHRLKQYPTLWKLLNGKAERRAQTINIQSATRIQQHKDLPAETAVIVGYGPVGQTVHHLLREGGLNTVVIDLNMDTISELANRQQNAIFGDASRPSILVDAGTRYAQYLIITLPQSSTSTPIISAAKELNPKIHILMRARYLREREELEQAGATAIAFEEEEAAVALAKIVLKDTGSDFNLRDREIREVVARLPR